MKTSIPTSLYEEHLGHGFEMMAEGDFKQSAGQFRRAIKLKPFLPDAYLALGSLLLKRNRLNESETYTRLALKINPNLPDACINLGQILKETGRLAEAEVYLRRAISLKPDQPEAYIDLGATLMAWNRLSEAEGVFRRAVELDPDLHEVYINMGTILISMGSLEEAESVLRQAIELNPDSPEACTKLGIVLTEMHRLAEAEVYLLRAGELRPDCSDSAYLLAQLHFLRGQYYKGWQKYEARFKVHHGIYMPKIRRWKGEKLTGRRILLFHEQGFGDTLQFVRYGQLVAELGGETVIWVQKPLQRLLSTSPGGFITHAGESLPPGRFDYACSLLSLPFELHACNRLETIPRIIPYIKTSPQIAAHWRKTLAARVSGNTRKAGVVWAGNPRHKRDNCRSIPFAMFSRLFDMDNVNWISLQTGTRSEDATAMPEKVIDFSLDLVDFAETAGVLENLDLVITVDTAVAHLAGAMGKNTWLLLPFHPDARWQLEREDSPWYPTMRLFRQNKRNDWSEVLAGLKAALSCRDWSVMPYFRDTTR